MIQKKHVFISLIFLITFSLHGLTLFNEEGSEWKGLEALQNEEFEKAAQEIIGDTLFQDTAYYYLKLGVAYGGLKKYSEALYSFKKSAQLSDRYAPFAYEKIADIAFVQKRFRGAIQALRTAVEKTDILPYRFRLYEKMYEISKEHSDEVGEIEWLEEIVREKSVIELEKTGLELLKYAHKSEFSKLDSILSVSVTGRSKNDELCRFCNIKSLEKLSTENLFLISKVSKNCKLYSLASDWLHEALKRKDFSDVVNQKEYLAFRAELNYSLKNYNNTIKWAKKYRKQYGETSDMIYLIARSYRRLGKASQATFWYDKHIKLFPYHKKSHDIIWYRAWQMEDDGKWKEAREFYKKLYEIHKNRSKADDSSFRFALSYYREERFENALKSFDRFLKRYPSSFLIPGAKYWKSRCYFESGDTTKGVKTASWIVDNYPNDYYAYRSKVLLEKYVDSSALFCMDTMYQNGETVEWLDSVSRHSGGTFTCSDTARFILGTRIAAVGMLDRAELILEPFEVNFYKNLLVQYELARLYKVCGNADKSFRVIKKLTWRIPLSARKCMPAPMYSLIYPSSYKNRIIKEAAIRKVEPELVSSIIRQESMFNPVAVSPVGAIGLMQIMPYTGEEIAGDLNDTTFVVDSLYSPNLNIRFGTYYISKLLKQFNGDKVLAIAGYNGGPHNAKKWKAAHSDDGFELFIEDIGFSETRKYVKKVLGNYWTYKKLNEFGVAEIFSDETLDSNEKVNVID